MSFCPKCKHENRESALFCEKCGSPLGNLDNQEKESKSTYGKETEFTKMMSFRSSKGYLKIGLYFAAVMLCVFSFFNAFSFISGKIDNVSNFVQEKFQNKTVNITNVILLAKEGIQEVAVAKSGYTIKKDRTTTQGLFFCDYVTQKFICDFNYNVKYGYDLSSWGTENITEDKNNKTVTVRMPKGKVLSNELVSHIIRHNEGVLLDFNKVKAEEINTIEQEAKKEALQNAENDPQLKNIAEKEVKLFIEKIVHSVAPDYKVNIVAA